MVNFSVEKVLLQIVCIFFSKRIKAGSPAKGKGDAIYEFYGKL